MTGIFAFNGNTKHQQIIDTYIKRLAIDTVVESGTAYGFTTAYFAERVKEVPNHTSTIFMGSGGISMNI